MGEDEFDLEALEEAKIRKLKMLASLKVIRKAQMMDNTGKKKKPEKYRTSSRTYRLLFKECVSYFLKDLECKNFQ